MNATTLHAASLLAATLLTACQVATRVTVPTPTPSAAPTAAPATLAPSPAPSSAASPTPSPTPSPGPRRGIGVTFRGDPGIPVGQAATVTALPNGNPFDGPLTWRLDPTSAARARLEPLPENQCRVTVLVPGAIRVIAASPTREGEILLAGIATPAPGTRDPDYPGFRMGGPLPLDGVWVIRSPLEWARFWEASRQAEPMYSAPVRPAPGIDWAQQSLVLLAETSTGGQAPVLTEVDPTGLGRVVAVRPVVWHDAPTPSAQGTSLRVYRTARLPATTVVEYLCDAGIGCPEGTPSLPDLDPFEGVEGRALTVGLPLVLPTGWIGEPLSWTIAPRSEGRGTIKDGRLRPLAPGPLVLEVRAGGRVGYVLHAVQPAPPLTRPLQGPYFPSGARGFTTPAVASDEPAWQALWGRLWGAPGTPTSLPTAPPPPPPAPAIAFPGRSVLVVDVDVQAHQASQPVVTAIENGVVQVVVPDVRLPGRPDPYAPRRAAPGEPVPDFGPFRGPRSVVFDLPALPAGATVVVEPFPEAAEVK